MVNSSNNTNSYYYVNENNTALYKVECKECLKDNNPKKSFQLFSRDSNWKWVTGLKNINPVLYMLPSLTKAIEKNETIVFADDEESVKTLQRLGITATTAFGGVGNFNTFSKLYAEQIKNAGVVILPGNSEYSRNKDCNKRTLL